VVTGANLLELLDLFLGSLVLEGKEVGVLLVGGLAKFALSPEIGGQIGIGVADGEEGSLDKVTHGLRATLGLGVHIMDTSELKDLLGHAGSDNTGTTGSGDKTDGHGTALSRNLHRDSVWITDHVTPISTAYRDDGKLGNDDGTTDGSGNFLGALDTQANMPIRITDNDKGLETGSLPSLCLLLHGHNLHHLVL